MKKITLTFYDISEKQPQEGQWIIALAQEPNVGGYDDPEWSLGYAVFKDIGYYDHKQRWMITGDLMGDYEIIVWANLSDEMADARDKLSAENQIKEKTK